MNRQRRHRANKRTVPPTGLATAYRHHRAGNLEAAERGYERILRGAPDQHQALYLLGLVRIQKHAYETAIGPLERAARLAPNEAPYHYNLGEAYRLSDRLDESLEAYRRAESLAPDVAEVHLGMGRALAALDAPARAARYLERARALAPDDSDVLTALGTTLLDLGGSKQAVTYLTRVAQRADAEPDSRLALAAAHIMEGDVAAGVSDCRALADDAGGDVDLLLAIGNRLTHLGLADEALPHFRAASAAAPERTDAACFVGRTLQDLGRFAEAEEAYAGALAQDPRLALAYYGLSGCRRFSADDPWRDKMEHLHRDPEWSEGDRATLLFGLAKMCDDAGDYDRAFELYDQANTLQAPERPFDCAAFARAIDETIATFDEDFFAARRGFGMESERPVFVLGMPRSGTSLVEQILASHPKFFGGGERPEMRLIVGGLPWRLKRDARFPHSVVEMDAELSRALGEEQDARLARLAPEALRVSDKTPNNFLRLAFIALIFPRARIIHCRRNPVDTCLSCYMQSFYRGQEFSYDLTKCGRYYRDYLRLMEHWRRVLPLEMLEVDYETLVADPEHDSRRLVDFVGLDWDPACLTPHKTGRTVRTASAWQVRQPIYRTSTERWRRYESHLDPLLEALGPEVISDDGGVDGGKG